MDRPTEQSSFWDDRADAWARHAEAMEPFASQFGRPALDLVDLAPGRDVADLGCGPGLTTMEIARRVGPSGTATGLDVSPRMIQTATARAEAGGLRNVRFEVGDPGDGPIGRFDSIFSRFGVMFFDAPATAFRNIAGSIRPGGLLVAVVWAELDANPWMFLPTMFAAGPLDVDLALPAPGEPGPFSLSNATETVSLLESCGFVDVEVVRREGEWAFDTDTADDVIAQMLSVGAVGAAWAAADPRARAAAVEAVRAGCGDHRRGDAWRLPATALIVSAAVGS